MKVFIWFSGILLEGSFSVWMETPFLFYLESENYLSRLVGGGGENERPCTNDC